MSGTRVLTVERSTSTAHRLLHYDGACGNVHGHNIHWEVEAEVSMAGAGSDNMPVDLKDISGRIDDVDHALILNYNDHLSGYMEDGDDTVLYGADRSWHYGRGAEEYDVDLIEDHDLGPIFLFSGDPTCEMLSQWVAHRLVDEIDPIVSVEVVAYETDKYGVTATAEGCTCGDEEACSDCPEWA